jgi:hypothetical protein
MLPTNFAVTRFMRANTDILYSTTAKEIVTTLGVDTSAELW